MSKIKLTTTRLFVAAFLLCFSMTLQTQAAPGDLDPSFGNGGKVVTPIGNGDESARAVLIQADGKIVAVGGSYNATNGDKFELARYNTDGSLDISFGTDGKVVTAIGNRAGASAVAIQSNGKIVAAGYAEIGGLTNFALVRYNTNGSLDTSFGTGGIVLTPNSYDGGGADAVAIQSDGKIVATGYVYISNSDTVNLVLVRYNANGSLDASFGLGGKVLTDFYSSGYPLNAYPYAVAIQSDGKIVVAGSISSSHSGGASFLLVRYNTNGSLDSTFGSGGMVVTSFGGGSDVASDIEIQSDGKIVAAGYSNTGNSYKFALARYNTSGSLDTTFGTGGKVLTAIGNGAYASALAIQSDGKIVVAGGSSLGGFTLARYNTNGSLDTAFGTGGIVATRFDNGSYANAVAIQSDGKIVAAGYSDNGANDDFALVRYLGDSNTRRTQFDFDGDGKADVSVFRPSEGNWYLLQSTNGFTGFPFGVTTDKLVPADYDGDGKTDAAVNRPGEWFLRRSRDGFLHINFGQAGDVPMPADYDGDGRSEIAVFRPGSGVWSIYNLSNNQTTDFAFGQSGDVPAAADYDGDGKTDFAVFRPSTGTWYLQRSALGFAAAVFGLGTDKPVPADYDGDGKADIAVFRQSNGTWYLLQSLAGFTGIQFGFGTDKPVPADYDGDGKTDIAVFRDGTWYLQRSRDGFTGIGFGFSTDKPVPNALVP